MAATTLSERNAAFAAGLAGLDGVRIVQDNAHLEARRRQAAPGPPGRLLSRLPLAPQHGHVLDGARRHRPRRPARSTTCVARTAGRTAGPGAASTPRTTGSPGWRRCGRPAPRSSSCPSRSPAAARPFTTRGSSTGARANARPDAAAPFDHQPPHGRPTHALNPAHPAPDLFALPPTGRDRDRRGVLPGAVAGRRLPLAVACRIVAS